MCFEHRNVVSKSGTSKSLMMICLKTDFYGPLVKKLQSKLLTIHSIQMLNKESWYYDEDNVDTFVIQNADLEL